MIKTILAFGYVILSMILYFPLGLIGIVFRLLRFKKLTARFVHWFGYTWSRSMIKVIGCTVTVTGVENIPKEGGVCFVSNHDGYFDIILLFAYSGRLIGFIAKKELLFIPLLNCWIYMVGGLFIDRKNGRKAIRTINKGVERIKSGGSLVIFPEGHRSKGKGLQPFHPGSLKLATMAEAPIVPVAIKGTYEVFEKDLRVKSTELKLTFCEPIETAGIPTADRKLVLSDKIYSVIKEKLET
ncbi:MAG: 1-acyl-sn-glycerol-3-phosphate acyltransferase [Treponema sp.]|nr:1-acyl-sn-glycerol-3-phosphate acyltransferase [Treponema sp.]